MPGLPGSDSEEDTQRGVVEVHALVHDELLCEERDCGECVSALSGAIV